MGVFQSATKAPTEIAGLTASNCSNDTLMYAELPARVMGPSVAGSATVGE
jgi:hypothetical protein